MIHDLSQVLIYLKPGATDMRKQINGLAVIVSEELAGDVFDGSLYLFCNRARTHLKILYWDRNGFCLWLKRLEKHRFPWPKDTSTAREITHQELRMLLQGIDFFNSHETLHFSQVS